MADFGADTDLEAFRKEARDWLEANFPAALKGKAALGNAEVRSNDPDLVKWRKAMGEKGWGTPTWPKEYGGGGLSVQQSRVLGQEMAKVGAFNPLMFGMGVTMIGPTIMDYGTEEQKRKHLPPIIKGEVQWCVGYSEPNAGSDAASMRLKGVRGERDGKTGWILNGQKTWTTSAHFAEWYWLGVRTDPDNKHRGITLMLVPLDQPGITINKIDTMGGVPMGDERTNEVFIDDVFVPDEYVVGEVNSGFQYISQALDLERFTMFTYSPIKQRLDVLVDHVRNETVDGEPLKDDPIVRQRIGQLATEAEVARVMGLRVVSESMKADEVPGTPPPTVESSEYKLFATEFSKRLADASMDLGAPGTQLRVKTEEAPMEGRAESTYRYTVIDTIGGGSSEIQKNVIARRGLGLPKNF